MKKIITLSYSIILLSVAIYSCAKKPSTTTPTNVNYAVGTWNVDRYELSVAIGAGPMLSSTYENIGTYTFYPDHKGNYALTFNGNPKNNNITWTSTATAVNITENDTTTHIYNVMTNDKNKQVWKTDYNENGNSYSIIISLSK